MEDQLPLPAGTIRVDGRALQPAGPSSVLMRVMNDVMRRALHGPAFDPAPTLPADRPGVPGAHGPLHRSVVL